MDPTFTQMDVSTLPPLPPSPTFPPTPTQKSSPSSPIPPSLFAHDDGFLADSDLLCSAPTSAPASSSLPALAPITSQSRDINYAEAYDDPSFLEDSATPLRPPVAASAEPQASAPADSSDSNLVSHLSLLRTELAARQAALAAEESQFATTLASSPSAVQSIVDTILTMDDLAAVDGPELEKHFHTPGFCVVPSNARHYFLPMFTAPSLPGDSIWSRAKSVAANCATLALVTLGMVVEFVLPGVQCKEYYVALNMANVGRRLKSERADVRRAEEVVRIGEAVLAHHHGDDGGVGKRRRQA
ncbi:hypothetical protein BCR44DRAFT_1024661 [Catenaria anguillulae PL171]|uniref:Uncharacterized protein n=1 Tax=Catenaria anguillulae PL171 TaxID=765915 RepID=A0A1Y2HVL3_9FUNG|nr:hypothetical protein BCR44DRAFT_1024661 [Catenaria anguillulae PL171]